MRRSALLGILGLACLALTATACRHGSAVVVAGGGTAGGGGATVSDPSRGKGPPDHAPAHGYRRKHHDARQGAELVFDARLGVYVVVDLPRHYYWDGVYLRVEEGAWYASARLDGGWEPRSSEALPPGLRKSLSGAKEKKGHGHAGRGRGRGRGPVPAKGRW